MTFLGKGCFGQVYKEERNGVTCAVRKIPKYRWNGMEDTEVLMDLDHDHIIKCLSHHTEKGGHLLCIVMEFADKGTLQTIIAEQAQNIRCCDPDFKKFNIWRFISQLADALNYLHTRRPPILHMNLKPDNILGQTQSCGTIRWKSGDCDIAKLSFTGDLPWSRLLWPSL